MQLLEGKNALIFGVANKHSIAWGIAESFHAQGANVGLSYAIPKLERKIQPLVEKTQAPLVEMCDVTDDAQIEAVMQKAEAVFGRIDILVHAVAFAQRSDLEGSFLDTTREGFAASLDISAYSLVALTRAAKPLMQAGSNVLTLSYYGAEKVIPHYNVMGVAKAALEASVRYLAADLGPEGMRVNAISAGPIKTLSASGIAGFRRMLAYSGASSPLRRNVTQTEVGQSALWLCSELASGVTGEVVYVDAGYHTMGMPVPSNLLDGS